MTKKYCTNDFYQKTRYLNIVKDYLSADTFMTLYHTILYPFYIAFVPFFEIQRKIPKSNFYSKNRKKWLDGVFVTFFRFFRYQIDS